VLTIYIFQINTQSRLTRANVVTLTAADKLMWQDRTTDLVSSLSDSEYGVCWVQLNYLHALEEDGIVYCELLEGATYQHISATAVDPVFLLALA